MEEKHLQVTAEETAAYFARLTEAIKGVPAHFVHNINEKAIRNRPIAKKKYTAYQGVTLRPMCTSRFGEPESVSHSSDVSEGPFPKPLIGIHKRTKRLISH
jgi:hypothetical protein